MTGSARDYIRERPEALRVVVGLSRVCKPDCSPRSGQTEAKSVSHRHLPRAISDLYSRGIILANRVLNDSVDMRLTNGSCLIQEAVRCTKSTVRDWLRLYVETVVPIRQLWLEGKVLARELMRRME